MTNDVRTEDCISRRDFFGGLGIAAGSLSALGAGVTLPSAARAAILQRPQASMTAGIALELDGRHTGFALDAAFDGVVADVEYSPGSQARATVRSVGVPSPLRLRFNHLAGRAFMEWIDSSAAVDTLSIVVFNRQTLDEIYRFEMRGAFPTEFRLATLDAESAELLSFDATLQMATCRHLFPAASRKVPAPDPARQRQSISSGYFRMSVEDLEAAAPYIQSVEGVTRYLVQQVGAGRSAIRDPRAGTLAARPFKLRIAPQGARPLLDWTQAAVSGTLTERQGRLDLFGRDGVLMAGVDFIDMLPRRATCPFPSADGTTSPVEIELACRALRFDVARLFA